MFAAPCKKAMSCSLNSPSEVLSTSNTPNGEPSPCRMTFMARRTPCSASNSGVLKRCSFSRWLEITGFPVQRVTAGRFKVGSNTCRANNPFLPANSGTNQKSVFRRDILQDLAVFGFQSLGCNASAVLEHVHKGRTLQRKDAELREQFLLPNALPESAAR